MVSIGHQVLSAILTHRFSVGHDFSDHAVELALTKGTANTSATTSTWWPVLALAAGMIVTMVGAMRVGLLTRWMGVLGIFTGSADLPADRWRHARDRARLLAYAMGMLYAERWPGGDPPAWTSGEARPWPSRADQRAAAQAGEGEVLAGAGAGDRRASPALPGANGSAAGKRRRKREGARSGEGQRPE